MGYDEFKMLYHRVAEKMRAMQRGEEIARATSYGFSREKLRELRNAFNTLDVDHNGVLDGHELRRAMRILGYKNVTGGQITAVCREVGMKDANGSLCLDFLSFLKLMHDADEGQGIFARHEDDDKKHKNGERPDSAGSEN